jgi:hypothetical protein
MGHPVPRRPGRNQLDPFTAEYESTIGESLDRFPVSIFLCGSAVRRRSPAKRRLNRHDIRLFLKKKLESNLKQCKVKLGEHKALIRVFARKVGPLASNLADHELGLAREKMDLVIIFPCSPGSFAELGMFCVVEAIAEKMRIFVQRKYRNNKSYVMQGPVKAAEQNNAKIFFVDYSEHEEIWNHVRDIVLGVKARKRKHSLVSE